LIRENTRFWNVSGISVDAGIFSGVQIDTETLEAIIAGGIAFATPGGEELADRVEQEHHFRLFDEAEDDWIEWEPDIELAEW
jgi:paraquat-inducible protein B